MTVQRDTIIAQILQNDPEQGCVPIFLNTGMHCLGCMAAHGETVEEACAVRCRLLPTPPCRKIGMICCRLAI